MAIAGRVAIVPKGDWSADATYKRLDAVTYNNTLYFAKKEVPAGTETSNTEYWSKSIVGGAGSIATKEDVGIVKPADGLTVAEDGTLKVSIDGTTLTMDQVNNVIKLADTLKEKINGAFPTANVVNNQITTETGYALDARQANPNIDGSLAKQISDLNGSLKMIDCGTSLFSKSGSAINVGTNISTRVTFHKKFNSKPTVVVSFADLQANAYLYSVLVDQRYTDTDGFTAASEIKHADAWKYNWYFYWIAIGQ